ncbi:MAG: hypothetical protein IH586_21980 [Anaerolineaceae bacterium]|nr:hypothetical protein [Anaerolineaceae bacterium]
MMPRLLLVVCVLVIVSLACNLPGTPTTTPIGSSALITDVARTLQSMETPSPTASTQVSATQTPTISTTKSEPATVTSKPYTLTVTTQPCDQAQFISDVTIPDGTKMVPGQTFTKTWRLRNLGSCSWDNRYAMVFASGDAMGAAAVINLPGTVPANTTVDLSIEMKAPATPGKYMCSWKLRNPAGQVFGVVADQPFFAQITVIEPTVTITPTQARTFTLTPPVSGVIYDFTTNVCKAEWRSQAGATALPCPGTSGDANGFVMRLENPTLETGAIESAPVLLTVPKNEASGVITGRYAGITIQNGYHLRATLGCLNGMNSCSVVYQVNYAVGTEVKNLGEWSQVYDGSIQGIELDLSSLAGQTVDIIFVVLAGDNANQDQAVWVYPRIMK